MDEIRVIIKRPDEKIGHIETINNTLNRFQIIVKGYIETVTLGSLGAVIICNEYGKINKLDPNFKLGRFRTDTIMGTAVICGTKKNEFEEIEFADVPFDLESWADLLRNWGNVTD